MRALRFVRSIPILRARSRWIAVVAGLGMIAYLPSSAEFAPADPHTDIKEPHLAKKELDHPLSGADAKRYRKIFALQTAGDWTAADKLIEELDEKILLGHVLAERYLYPTGYKLSPARGGRRWPKAASRSPRGTWPAPSRPSTCAWRIPN